MIRPNPISGALAVLLLTVSVASAQNISNRETADTTPDSDLPREVAGQGSDLLSAFHGLDRLPMLANAICRRSRGRTGMPVILSSEIDIETMQAGDFRVITQSGEEGVMHCASVLPATDPGELRTVLLIGDLGPADTDPPVNVEIIGHLHSIDGALDYRGANLGVTHLNQP